VGRGWDCFWRIGRKGVSVRKSAPVCKAIPKSSHGVAAGISAALSDHKWRAATNATLLTYAGLFALFLMWRLVATPLELDREKQRSIDWLNSSLAVTKSWLAALRARPPTIEVEISEIHVQEAGALAPHASEVAVDCDIFVWVKLTLTGTLPIGVLAYELSRILHGNSLRADPVNDIQDWGLVTQKKPVGVGTTLHYTVTRLMQLAHRVEQRGPVEGWLHFCANGVHEKEIWATVYRLSVLTPNGAISADIRGQKNLARVERREFQKIPYASDAFRH
jgi:hypothetical protein